MSLYRNFTILFGSVLKLLEQVLILCCLLLYFPYFSCIICLDLFLHVPINIFSFYMDHFSPFHLFLHNSLDCWNVYPNFLRLFLNIQSLCCDLGLVFLAGRMLCHNLIKFTQKLLFFGLLQLQDWIFNPKAVSNHLLQNHLPKLFVLLVVLLLKLNSFLFNFTFESRLYQFVEFYFTSYLISLRFVSLRITATERLT